MSFTRLAKVVLSTLAIFSALFIAGRFFVGPGLLDFSEPIINGYEYLYAGGNEKMIVYSGSELKQGIVVDSRVDSYKVEGEKILIARRPTVIYSEDNITKSKLLANCEYLVIDTKDHSIRNLNEPHGLLCE